MPLIFTLAARNLFHDRLRFVATLVGIVFSMMLVTVQMGLYLGFGRMVTTMIDHANADLWIMPLGTRCFEDPSVLDEPNRFRAVANAGRWNDTGFRHRLAHQVGWIAPVEPGRRQHRGSRNSRCRGNRPVLFRPARNNGIGRERRNSRAKGGGAGAHQGYPFLYDHALCLCAA